MRTRPLSASILARALLFLLCFALPAQAGQPTWSLVINGNIYDIPVVNHVSQGTLISCSLFVRVAKAAGGISLVTRPDKGHIVLTSNVKSGNISLIQDFKSPSLTFVVNGQTQTSRGQLVSGIPYVEGYMVQSVLEGLGLSVAISPEAQLISVFRAPPAEPEASAGVAHPPSAGNLMGVVSDASRKSLEAMGAAASPGSSDVSGAPSGSSSRVSSTSSAAPGVCAAMDSLRSLWAETEPSAKEKQAFRELATRFQNAKDSHQKLDPGDVEDMVATLKSFRAKVDKRANGTRGWTAPDPARKVKVYGTSFLDTFTQAMDLSQEMMDAIQANDKAFAQRAEEMIGELRGLEQTIQQQGTRFNDEVVRVRNAHGCGPATLGVPPS